MTQTEKILALLALSLVANLLGGMKLVDATQDRSELFEAVVACEAGK